MRVLQTIYSLDPRLGGPSSCTYDLMQGLRIIGANVDLLTVRSGDPQVENLGHGCSWLQEVDNDFKGPLFYSSSFKGALLESDYEIYHANTLWLYPNHITCRIAREKKRPYVLSPHGMLYPNALAGKSSWKKKIALPLFQRRDLEKASVLHATCDAEMHHLRNLNLSNPIAVIPNCLHVDDAYLTSSGEYRKDNDVKRVGFVGRIARIKNIDRILEAWEKLGSNTRDAQLIIVGDGDPEYMRVLRHFVSEKKLNNVVFKGFLSGKELLDEVHHFDFQVLMSTSENFGMVVPEALINRVPVIASKGTPWDILPKEQCGWWIDNTVDSLADTLLEALNLNEEDRRLMGEHGRNLVMEKYTMERVARQMLELYQYLLENENKPAFLYE